MGPHPLPTALEEKFREKVESFGLNALWPRLRAQARPSYTLGLIRSRLVDLVRRSLGRKTEELGTSRLGGLPDLPSELDWPEPTFIGQINLAEVPRSPGPLPGKGVLYFFLGTNGPAWNIQHSVLYSEEPGRDLSPRKPPRNPMLFSANYPPFFKPVRLQFLPTVSIPSYVNDPSMDEFYDPLEKLTQELENPSGGADCSRFLGYSTEFCNRPCADAYVATQGRTDLINFLHEMAPAQLDGEIQQARAKGDDERVRSLVEKKKSLDWFHENRARHDREIEHWQLLLEVDSHHELGMNWCDAGLLQFLIDTRDLGARNFSRTYACIQSH